MSLTLLALALIIRAGPSFEDLRIYLGALEQAGSGRLYEFKNDNGGGFTYPPIAAVVLAPLTWLPLTPDHLGWAWFTAQILVTSIVVLAVARSGRIPAGIASVLLGATLLAQPFRDAAHLGQLSPMISALALAGLAWPQSGGIATGVGGAVKLTPLATLFTLSAARHRSTLVTIAGVFLTVTGAGFLLDPDGSLLYWTDLLWRSERVGDLASLGNNSLRGMLARQEYLASSGRSGLLLWGAVLALLIALLHRTGTIRALSVGGTLAVGYVLSLIVSPVTWTHHAVLVPLLVGLLALRGGPSGRVALAVGFIWMLPVYPLAKLGDEHLPFGGDWIVDTRALSLIVLLFLLTRQDLGRPGPEPSRPSLRPVTVAEHDEERPGAPRLVVAGTGPSTLRL
jgi:alpha-1,2-mannosyltransferase